MDIKFITIDRGNDYEPCDAHYIVVDNKVLMRASEGLEPEDASFGRDLHSPFECAALLKLVHTAGIAGQDLNIIYETMTEEEAEKYEWY